MYSTVALDERNDIYLDSSGNLAMFYGVDAIEQLCKNAAQTSLGEMIFAINQGLPDFQSIWNGNPNLGQFEFALRNTLLSVPGVSNITSLNISIDNNQLFYTAIIITTLSISPVEVIGSLDNIVGGSK